MSQPDAQSMRTLPPISSLAQTDLHHHHHHPPPPSPHKSLQTILPASPRILPNPSGASLPPSSTAFHPHESAPTTIYYPLHVTAAPLHADEYAYDPSKTSSSVELKTGHMTSEQVLAEKRRRNAGASARFRDRRKQRERDITDKCHRLEDRVRELEQALSRATGQSVEEIQEGGYKPAQRRRRSSSVYSDESQDKNVMAIDNFQSLGERVTELENLVGHSRREKDASVKKLQELEKENSYLRSLLIPAAASSSQVPSTPPLSVSASPPTQKPALPRSVAATATNSDVGEDIEPKRRKLDSDTTDS